MRERWRGLVAVVALIVAAVCWWLRLRRERAWVDEMVATGCWPLLPVTDIALLAGTSVALVLLAGTLLLWAGIRRVRGGSVVAGRLQVAVSAVVLLGAVLLALAALWVPLDPLQGVDGSGLPCGGG